LKFVLLNIGSAAQCSHCHHIEEQYDLLVMYEPSERNGVAQFEKMKIGFCITAETS
jgi:hypothetical protein